MPISRNTFLRQLVDSLYSRNEVMFERGNFRVKGDTVEIFLAYADHACRIIFWGDEIEEIELFHPENGSSLVLESSQDHNLLFHPAFLPLDSFHFLLEMPNVGLNHIESL